MIISDKVPTVETRPESSEEQKGSQLNCKSSGENYHMPDMPTFYVTAGYVILFP